MEDWQFKILIGTITVGLGGIAAAIKWSVTTLTGSLDRNTAAHLESVKAMTVMSTKLDFVYNVTGKVEDFIKEERSGVHEVPVETSHKRIKTNPPTR